MVAHAARVLAVVAALLSCTVALDAQSVRGRVLDRESGAPIADVRVTLLRADGTPVLYSLSNDEGGFHVATWHPGPHRLQASHVGYRAVTTEPFEIGVREELVVDLVLSAAAIPLEPLTITARRRDVRDDPTTEGFYARQQLAPLLGNSRVITRLDPELASARDARDAMNWLPAVQGRPFGREGNCLVVYFNGQLLGDVDAADIWLATPAHLLEGLEYYRSIHDAPLPFRQVPGYLYDCSRHTVIALWSRTGYFGDLHDELRPSSRRINVATGVYHLSGARAPGFGTGIEAAAHWPVLHGVAFGLTLRRSAHHLSADDTEASLSPIVAPLYRLPPGRRPLALWVGGVEGRATLGRTAGVWPVVAARLQAAHRSFSLRSSSEENVYVAANSLGLGVGVTAGAEILVRGRFAVHAALGYDRLFFGPYSEIEHRTNPTAAQWAGTSLRIGGGYALAR
jgi:hypothetical protein